MSNIEIITVQFNYPPPRPNYKVLLDVFQFSVKKFMPNAIFIKHEIKAPPNKTNRPLNFNYNDVKLKIWRDHMRSTKNNVIFADCDMLMLRSAEHAFKKDFDVAYTARTIIKRIPMNGGIVFARPTKRAIAFFNEWYNVNHKMLHDITFHHEWRARWAGMNQAAFGYMHDRRANCAKLKKYITRTWNAVDCDWNFIDENTVFCHYKSKLRKLVLSGKEPFGIYRKAMNIWYRMNDEMKRSKMSRKRRKKTA
jgi:hypothetical protein